MASRKIAPSKTASKTASPTPSKTSAHMSVRAQRAQPAASTPKSAKPALAAEVAAAARASKPVAKAVKAATPKKAPKLRKKPVRDSFTMPEADFALIATLKARAMSAKRETKKSELLRAGLHALALLDTQTLVAALGRLQPVKVGRPKSGH